jgi:hypothetical protein
MPARSNKTYVATTVANAASIRLVPTNPRRISLMIQNTGAVTGNVRFGGSTQGGVNDFEFPSGLIFKWDQADTCPLEDINLSTPGGGANGSWVIMEGTLIP